MRLLDKIKFSSSDTMYVLGDFLDKGKHSIKLGKFISGAQNMVAICGNHEHYFIQYYQSLMRGLRDNDNIDLVLKRLQEYFYAENEPISWDFMDFLESMPRIVSKSECILVHAGVELDKSGGVVDIKAQDPNTFIFTRKLAESSAIVQYDKTILFGHTPCYYQNNTGHIIKTSRQNKSIDSAVLADFAKVQLDTGVSFTGLLGCLRGDDMREFYVKS